MTDRPSTTTVDGDRRIAYAEYGDPAGTPVVFLHGTPGSRLLAGLFDADAAERGIRLVTPDRPGFGRSDPWPGRSVRDAADVVRAVLDDVGVEAAGVVGFSGGSAHAFATAATYPERVRRVDVVAGATPPDVGDETPAVQRILFGLAGSAPLALRGLFRGQAWLAAKADPSFVLAQYTDDAESVPDAVAEAVKADFLEAFAESRSGAVTEFRNTATDWGIPFEDVACDVGLWHGDDDANVPIDGVRELESRLPTATLTTLDGADHLGTLLRATPEVLDRHA